MGADGREHCINAAFTLGGCGGERGGAFPRWCCPVHVVAMANHDWLWSQCHEVRRGQTTAVVNKSMHELRRFSQIFTQGTNGQIEHPEDDTFDNYSEKVLDSPSEWKKHLSNIKRTNEHIYAPASVSAGQSGVAHKCSTQQHQYHLDLQHHGSFKHFISSNAPSSA